jgi:hypothetical protein
MTARRGYSRPMPRAALIFGAIALIWIVTRLILIVVLRD